MGKNLPGRQNIALRLKFSDKTADTINVMEILPNSSLPLQPPPASSVEEAEEAALREPLPEEEAAQDVLVDSYTPYEAQEDAGLYTREGIIQKMRETQEALLNTVAEGRALPIDAQKLSELQLKKGAASQGKPNEQSPNEEKEDSQPAKSPNELDPEEKDLVERLQQRDREVRAHEQSHVALAGEYARGAPSYTYQMGPDGKMYAVGGELAVDTGKEADPAENRIKSQILQTAAMGVEDPSTADALVAMQAANLKNS